MYGVWSEGTADMIENRHSKTSNRQLHEANFTSKLKFNFKISKVLRVSHIQAALTGSALMLLMPLQSHAIVQIFPIQHLLGIEQACQPNQSLKNILPNSANECFLKQAFKQEQSRENAEQRFVRLLHHHFQHLIVTETQLKNVKVDETKPLFVASLEVINAQESLINRDKNTEIYLPITLNLKLTHAITGQVVYSKSAMREEMLRVTTKTLGSARTLQLIQEKVELNFNALLDHLSQNLSEAVQFSFLETQVKGRWGSYLVLNQGLMQGISLEDVLRSENGDLIRIVYADQNYAVALPLEKKPIEDTQTKFLKVTYPMQATVYQPQANVIDVLNYKDESKELIEHHFANGVGSSAFFKLNQQNTRYTAWVKNMKPTWFNAHLSYVEQREQPEHFIRLNVMPVMTFRSAKSKEPPQFRSEVFAEMINRTGQVVYSTHVTEHLDSEKMEQTTLSLEGRKENILKSALEKLGQNFKSGIRFKQFDLQILGVNTQKIMFEDRHEALMNGTKIKIYQHKLLNGETIKFPIWKATVVQHKNEMAIARLDAPVSPLDQVPVRIGDHIYIDSTLPIQPKSIEMMDKSKIAKIRAALKM